MKAITVTSSGYIDIVEKDWDYKQIYQFVGGAIEAVSFGSNDFFAYINEEGKLLDLPENRIATNLWYDSGQVILLGDYIAGNAVFFGVCDTDGFKQNVPETLWVWVYNTQDSLIRSGHLDPYVDPTNYRLYDHDIFCEMCSGTARLLGSLVDQVFAKTKTKIVLKYLSKLNFLIPLVVPRD
jgi:hypothetical protein